VASRREVPDNPAGPLRVWVMPIPTGHGEDAMRRSRLVAAAVLTVGALLFEGQAGAAMQNTNTAGGFGPPVTVVNAEDCRLGPADVVGGRDGLLHGFASLLCSSPVPQLVYVEGRDGRWSGFMAPYDGRVIAVATDATGTYVLLQTPSGVGLAKRTRSGRFLSPQPLSGRMGLGSGFFPDGDLVAAGGAWWAVWNERLGGTGSPERLFQAKTIGTDVQRQRITWWRPAFDDQPTLALRPGGGAVLAWTRYVPCDDCVSGFFTRVFLGSSRDGRWSFRPLSERGQATFGSQTVRPDLATVGRSVVAPYVSGHDLVVVENVLGRSRKDRLRDAFAVPPPVTRVTGSKSGTFVAWHGGDSPAPHVMVAQRRHGGWRRVDVTPDAVTDRLLVAMVARGRTLTVLYSDGTRLVARTQRLA